jgi:predicted nucleic acid-binding Zn ribbon protein
MKSIRDILNNQRSPGKIAPIIDEKTVLFIFSKVLTSEMGAIGRQKFKANKFINQTIIVTTESSAWAQELWLHREKIVQKINSELGQDSVARIKIN